MAGSGIGDRFGPQTARDVDDGDPVAALIAGYTDADAAQIGTQQTQTPAELAEPQTEGRIRAIDRLE